MKSIESMWKEGFVDESQFSAPKVNDLYNRKSQNIVDKMQKMFSINVKAIVLGAIAMLIAMSLAGMPYLAVYLFCLVMPIAYIANRELKKSFELSKGESSYDYLNKFNAWLQGSIKTYSDYYRIFYPLFFLGMAAQAVAGETGSEVIMKMMEKFPTEWVLLGLPYYVIISLIGLLLLVIRYADALYRLDLNIIYGRQFKKLDELLKEMEELRK